MLSHVHLLKVIALVVCFLALLLWYVKKGNNNRVRGSTLELQPPADAAGTLVLSPATNTTITTDVLKCSASLIANSGDAVRHMFSINKFVFSPLYFIRNEQHHLCSTVLVRESPLLLARKLFVHTTAR